MPYFLLSFALWSAFFIDNATASQESYESNANIVFNVESDASLGNATIPRFQGFVDECEAAMSKSLSYTPKHLDAHTDLGIESRNSDVDLWVKTCSIPTKMDWVVPEGFTSLRTQVYYAVADADRFGHMRYQGSVDGVTWTDISDIDHAPPVCMLDDSCRYQMMEETKSWAVPYYHFRAIPPPPFQPELAGDAETNLYYAPQLRSLILGEWQSSPHPPTHLRLASGYERLTVSWQPPIFTGGHTLLGYLVEIRIVSPAHASQTDSNLSYKLKRLFVPARVTLIIFSNLDPSRIYSVRVAAVNKRGAGRYTNYVWGSPLPVPTQATKVTTTTMAPTPPLNATNGTMAPTPPVNATNGTMAPTPPVNATNATMAPTPPVNATNATMTPTPAVNATLAPTTRPMTPQPPVSSVPPSPPVVGTTMSPTNVVTPPPRTPIPVASVNPDATIESPAVSSIFGVSGSYSVEMWSVLLAAVIAYA